MKSEWAKEQIPNPAKEEDKRTAEQASKSMQQLLFSQNSETQNNNNDNDKETCGLL